MDIVVLINCMVILEVPLKKPCIAEQSGLVFIALVCLDLFAFLVPDCTTSPVYCHFLHYIVRLFHKPNGVLYTIKQPRYCIHGPNNFVLERLKDVLDGHKG